MPKLFDPPIWSLKRRLKARWPRAWKALHAARLNLSEYSYWSRRIAEVMQCPDNARIPRVANAGCIRGGVQLMHNGLRVCAGSYYGWGGRRVLRRNRGGHEPQEEFAFMQVLRGLAPGSVMVECGAYWGFYSLWFCKAVPGGAAHLIEPELENLSFGRRNFELNGLSGTFHRAFVGAESHSRHGDIETVCLDDFMNRERLQRIDLLHADIQGAELDLLRGAVRSLARGAVLFLFISTHSEELHAGCQKLLLDAGYDCFISIPPSHSFSVDGVLVSCREDYSDRKFEQPSRKAAK